MIDEVRPQNTREQGQEGLRCGPFWSIASDQEISEKVREDQ